MIKWNHIQDVRPQIGREILKLEYWPNPSTCEYSNILTRVGTWDFDEKGFEENQKYLKECSLEPWNFWWIYTEELNFPKG